MNDSNHSCLLLVIQSPIVEPELIGSDDATVKRSQREVAPTHRFWENNPMKRRTVFFQINSNEPLVAGAKSCSTESESYINFESRDVYLSEGSRELQICILLCCPGDNAFKLSPPTSSNQYFISL